jgi:hypothetical protein
MGYILRREIRDLIPPSLLTAKERCLVLELADNCGEETREGWPGAEWLAEKADISEPKRVGEHFASVAKKWVELRVPLGVAESGRPYYSHPRKRTRYRFPSVTDLREIFVRMVPQNPGPNMVPENQGPSEILVPENPGSKVPGFPGSKVPENPEVTTEWSRVFGDPSPQSTSPQEKPSSLSSAPPDTDASPDATEDREKDEAASDSSKTQNQPASVAHRLLAEHDITGDEADRLIPLVEGFSPGTKGPGWWRHIHSNGDLAELIVKARAQDADPSSGRPAWCGDCDEHNRQTYREDPHGRGMVLMRCPSCHPLTQPAQSTTDRKFAQAMDLAARFDAYDNRIVNHPEPGHRPRSWDRGRHSAVMAGGPGSRYDPPPGHRAVIQGVIASQVVAEDSGPDPYDAPL